MKLYTNPGSSSSRRPMVVAHHLGLELEHHVIDLAKPADRAVLQQVNPNNKIPVLVAGDFVLSESAAIMKYLCAQAPAQTLWPSDLKTQLTVDKWLFWNAQHLATNVGFISFEKLWKKLVTGQGPDPAIVARHEALFHPVAKVLDGALSGGAWIVGDSVTLADIAIACTLMYAIPTQLPLDPYPNVRGLIDRVHALPAWRATEPR